MRTIENFLANVLSPNLGKLLLRFVLGFLMLLHGYNKYVHGIDGIKGLVVSSGFPELLAYGVYVGEFVAPILIILGLYTRLFSVIFAGCMAFAIYLAHSTELFLINERTGALVLETQYLYLFVALVLVFTGPGKYSIDTK